MLSADDSVEDDALSDYETSRFSHVFIQLDGSHSETRQARSSYAIAETLNLAQGENWLRLVISTQGNSVLDDTQETSLGTTPYPSLISLSEMGTIDAPTDDCFICIDVDGYHVTIKDMRNPRQSQDDPEVFDMCISRRKKLTEGPAVIIENLHVADEHDDDDDEVVDLSVPPKYNGLEELPRRQLRLLQQGDRIVTRNSSSWAAGDGIGLVLEYRRYSNSQKSASHAAVADSESMSRKINSSDASTNKSGRHTPKSDATRAIANLKRTAELKANKAERPGYGSDFESYMSGDVLMRDQGYISGITGDEEPFPNSGGTRKAKPSLLIQKSTVGSDHLLNDAEAVEEKGGEAMMGTSCETNAGTENDNPETQEAALSVAKSSQDGNDARPPGEPHDDESSASVDSDDDQPTQQFPTPNGLSTQSPNKDIVNSEDESTSYRADDEGAMTTEVKDAAVVHADQNLAISTKPSTMTLSADCNESAKQPVIDLKNDESSDQQDEVVGGSQCIVDANGIQSPTPKLSQEEWAPVDVKSHVNTDKAEISHALEDTKANEASTVQNTGNEESEIEHQKSEGGHRTKRIGRRKDVASENNIRKVPPSNTVKKAMSKRPVSYSVQDLSDASSITELGERASNDKTEVISKSVVSDQDLTDASSITELAEDLPNEAKESSTTANDIVSSLVDAPEMRDENITGPITTSDVIEKPPNDRIEDLARVVVPNGESSKPLVKATAGESTSSPPTGDRDRKSTVSPPLNVKRSRTTTESRVTPARPETVDLDRNAEEEHEAVETPVVTRGSSRKRTRTSTGSTSTRKRSKTEAESAVDDGIRVLTTGVVTTAGHKKMIEVIGGKLLENIEDAAMATHVIAGDKDTTLRRTPKLMIGMCKTSKIVNMDWLIQSAKARAPLPCNNFLLLNETEAEEKYNFSMRTALKRGDTLRRNGESLLAGYAIYVCKGVAGKKAPPDNELRLIVEAAGGVWLSSLSPTSLRDLEGTKVLIITSDPPDKKHLNTREVSKAIKQGAQHYTTSWLFHVIIAQELTDL